MKIIYKIRKTMSFTRPSTFYPRLSTLDSRPNPRLDNPPEFICIGVLQVTGHSTEIPGKFSAISTGCQGPVLVARNLWFVMILDLKGIIAVTTFFNSTV